MVILFANIMGFDIIFMPWYKKQIIRIKQAWI